MSTATITVSTHTLRYGVSALVERRDFVAEKNAYYEFFLSQITRLKELNSASKGIAVINELNQLAWDAASGAALMDLHFVNSQRQHYRVPHAIPPTSLNYATALRQVIERVATPQPAVEDTVRLKNHVFNKPAVLNIQNREVHLYPYIVDPNAAPADNVNAYVNRLNNAISTDQNGVLRPGYTAAFAITAYNRWCRVKNLSMNCILGACNSPGFPKGYRILNFIPRGQFFYVFGSQPMTKLNLMEMDVCQLMRRVMNHYHQICFMPAAPVPYSPSLDANTFRGPWNGATTDIMVAKVSPVKWETQTCNFIGKISLAYKPDTEALSERLAVARTVGKRSITTENAVLELEIPEELNSINEDSDEILHVRKKMRITDDTVQPKTVFDMTNKSEILHGVHPEGANSGELGKTTSEEVNTETKVRE